MASVIEVTPNDILNQAFTEYVDENRLRRCITYLLDENTFQRKGLDINQGINPAVYFAYLNNVKNGAVNILLKRGSGDKYGLYRKYETVPDCNACGACHFMREIRAALYKDAYIDLDIVNAYPNFMYAITKGKFLGEYINNRDIHLKEVMDTCNVSRDLAKQLFIMMGFGGNYSTWYNEHAKDTLPSRFVMDYYSEMQESRKTIIEYFNKFLMMIDCNIKRNQFQTPDGKQHKCHLKNIFLADSKSKACARQYEIDNGAISRGMQFLEVNLIREVYKKLQEIGIDVKTCVYCFDGCMVKKSELEKIGYTADKLCEVINQCIHELDFYIPLDNINFISKEFEQNDFDPMKYEPTTINSYEEYLENKSVCVEFPDEDFVWNKLTSLKKGDRTDRQVEYLNKYMVYDVNMCRFVLRRSKSIDSVVTYSPAEFRNVMKHIKCEKLIDSIQVATRYDDIEKPRKWLIRDTNGELHYSLFMGINPDIINGEYNEEIGKDFEEFVNTFGLADIKDIGKKEEYDKCEENIIPLKRIIGALARKAGTRLEIMVCIVSGQGFGKDTLFDTIGKWYDPSEVAKSSTERLFGNFNTDAGKCLVLLDECCDRGTKTVNLIKNYVTASEVTINKKYGNIETKTNKSTLFLFGNSTQGIPVEWETADRRALFYNLQNVPLRFSKAKSFLTKWSRHPAFYSSCYHKACEWFDPDFDFHRNISNESKDVMQSVNMPFFTEAIYYNKLFEVYTPSELIGQINALTDCDPNTYTMYNISREAVKQFGGTVNRRSNGKRLIDLTNVKSLIEQRYRIKNEDCVDYCEM